MALEESIENLEKVESNSIITYMDKKLLEYVIQLGKITIDYINNNNGGAYQIIVGNSSTSGNSC